MREVLDAIESVVGQVDQLEQQRLEALVETQAGVVLVIALRLRDHEHLVVTETQLLKLLFPPIAGNSVVEGNSERERPGNDGSNDRGIHYQLRGGDNSPAAEVVQAGPFGR